jgi:four helix bundle protein
VLVPLSQSLRRGLGMENKTKVTGAQPFVAMELALAVIRSLKDVVELIRKKNPKLAAQIVDAASSAAANIAEGNGRHAGNRRYHFRTAAGSAEETRGHLRVAIAWGWIEPRHIVTPLALLDRQIAVLWKLTH